MNPSRARSEKARNPGGAIERSTLRSAAQPRPRATEAAAPASATRRSRPTARCEPPKTVEDQDACALYAAVRRDGRATHDVIENGFVALQKMLHRAGNVDGEGDGCGVTGRHPARDLAGGGPQRRPRAQAGARPRVRGRARLRLAQGRHGADQARRAPDPQPRRPAACWPSARTAWTARRSGRPRARRSRTSGSSRVLVPDASARDRSLFDAAIELEQQLDAARRLVLGGDLRLQGDGRAEGPAALLRRPERPARRDRRAARAQPLLDQHLAVVHARPAVLGARATTARSTRSRACARRRACSARRSATTPRTRRT